MSQPLPSIPTNTTSSTRPIQVMIVDDHPLVRIGMTTVINQQPDMTVVGESETAQEAPLLYRQLLPDIVLMDLRLREDSGAEVTAQIRGEYPQARILVISNYEGDEDIRQALKAGAQGYLFKSIVEEELVDAIREINEGRQYLPKSVAGRLQEHDTSESLTHRESEMLNLLSKGLNNREMGQVLGIAEDTVKSHLKNLFRKFKVSSRAEAVSEAMQRGFIHE